MVRKPPRSRPERVAKSKTWTHEDEKELKRLMIKKEAAGLTVEELARAQSLYRRWRDHKAQEGGQV